MRRAVPEDAEGLVELAYRNYSYTYAKETFYYADRLREELRAERVISFVALNSAGAIVGQAALLALSLNLILGEGGLYDMGHAAFFAVGAYTTPVLSTRFEVPGLLTLPAAALAAGLFAALVALPVLRLRGDYLLIVTVGLTVFVLGSAWAGMAGTLFAAKMTVVSPESFGFWESVLVFTMVLLGGAGSIPGVLLGAFLVAGLPEVFRGLASARMLRAHGDDGREAHGPLAAAEGERGVSLLSVRDLAKRFGGVKAVDGVSFDVEDLQRGQRSTGALPCSASLALGRCRLIGRCRVSTWRRP